MSEAGDNHEMISLEDDKSHASGTSETSEARKRKEEREERFRIYFRKHKRKMKIKKMTIIVYCIIFLALLIPSCYYGWQEIKLQQSAANTFLNETGYEPRFTEFDDNDRTPLICEHNLTIGPVL